MKTSVERISYYLKKVSQYTSIHPSKKRNTYRWERLSKYKKSMHLQIKQEHSHLTNN